MKGGAVHRKGLGFKKEAREGLRLDYRSDLLLEILASGNSLTRGDVTVLVAKEFGFCYGVERTIQYCYETRMRFPDRRIFVTDEVIHNPYVNRKLVALGMEFLKGRYRRGASFDDLREGDVVIIPAFGVTVEEFEVLRGKGVILVDTTCGSVLTVWKNVERYARQGVTAIIHGKWWHEETRATASQVSRYPGAKALVVLDKAEAGEVCEYIEHGGDREAFLRKFRNAVTEGFEPDRDLQKVGLANQTTMLASESLEIGEMIRQAMLRRYGEAELDRHFVAFDTICRATQDRQDAIRELLEHPLDLVVLVGGFNSSNTSHLAAIAAEKVPTYFVESREDLISADEIRCREIESNRVLVKRGWLPEGKVRIGITAGASTPNNVVGGVIERIFALKG